MGTKIRLNGVKKLTKIVRNFKTLVVPLLFPKDFKYLKSLDIGLWEVGAKRQVNGVRKCDKQTNTQTHKHTYRRH